VFGGGPLDLVFVPGWVSHVEEAWEYPSFAAFLRRLGTFARVITFDKRGTGLSDAVPIDRLPTLEQRMDDVRAVMDAAASPRAAVFGVSEGGNMSVLFAATYPERTSALVTFGVYAKRVWSEDYPWAPRPEARAREIESVEREWARLDVTAIAPSASPG
jgi:pimeloyl-ACP methyl ester carboxylesterase